MASYKCDVSSIPFEESKKWLMNVGCHWVKDTSFYNYLYIDKHGTYYGVDNETFIYDSGEEVSYKDFKTHFEILLLTGNPM
jgi:hypothetical protein